MEPIFTPPRGLDRGRPREVRLSIAGRVLVVMIGLLLAAAPTAGVFMVRMAAAQRVERQRLADDGAKTDGVVTRLWRTSSKNSTQWSVAYQFEVEGRTYTGQSRIPRAWSKTLQVGGKVPVRFVVDEPRVSQPAGLAPQLLPLWVPYLVAAALVGLGLTALVGLRRERELLADGRVAEAVVTKHTTHHAQHGGSYRMMRYEFQLLSGATITGKSATSSKPPAIGSVICVLYDPERPTRNRPYPLPLVRLAET